MTRDSRKPQVDISVVVPAHNEENNVGPLLDQFAELVRRSRSSMEVVVVDDGSTDRTLRRLAEAQRTHRFVQIVAIPRRRGLTEALQAGFAVARGSIIVFYPADRQFHPNDIPRMVDKVRDGYDLVTGRKIGQYSKRVVSGVYSRVSRLLFPSIQATDLNSVKAFRRELINVFDYRHDWHRFWVAIVAEAGYRIGEVDVTLYERPSGRSKFGLWRIPGGVLDLLAVKFQYHTMRRPLWYFGMTGSALLLVAMVIGGWALFDRFVNNHGYRPLLYLVMTLGISGVVFFALGFLAESVAGIRQQLESMGEKRRYSLYHPSSRGGGGGGRAGGRSSSARNAQADSTAKSERDSERRSRRSNGERRRGGGSDRRREGSRRGASGGRSGQGVSASTSTPADEKTAASPSVVSAGPIVRRELPVAEPKTSRTGAESEKPLVSEGHRDSSRDLFDSRPVAPENHPEAVPGNTGNRIDRKRHTDSPAQPDAERGETPDIPAATGDEKPRSYGRRRRR